MFRSYMDHNQGEKHVEQRHVFSQNAAWAYFKNIKLKCTIRTRAAFYLDIRK